MAETVLNSDGDQYILYHYRTPLSWDNLSNQFKGIYTPGIINITASVTMSGNYPVAISELDLMVVPNNNTSHLLKMSTTTSFDVEIGTPDSVNKLYILARYDHDELDMENAVTFHVDSAKSNPEDIIVCKLEYSGITFTGISLAESDVEMGALRHSGVAEALFTIGVDEGTPVKLKNSGGELQFRNYADSAYSDVRLNDLVVEGDLTVNGTTTTVNSETLTIDDNMIVLNNNVTGTPSENSGIEIERGTSPNTSWYWDEGLDRWMGTNSSGTPITPIFEGGTVTLTGANVTGGPAAFDSSGNVSVATSLTGVALSGHTHALDDLSDVTAPGGEGHGNGFNADTVDGSHATDFATSGHAHPIYMDLSSSQSVTSGVKTWSGSSGITFSGSSSELILPYVTSDSGRTENGNIWIRSDL